MRILLALGGSALLRGDRPAAAPRQRREVEAAATVLAGLASEHELIIAHGRRPQPAPSALQGEGAPAPPPHPLDGLGAASEATAAQALVPALRNRLPERDVLSVLGEVVVAREDPAFRRPTRPVGPPYTSREAQRLRLERGWVLGREGGGYRRLLPAPEPNAIAGIRSLRVLVDSGALVIWAGGGAPLALDGDGTLHEVEAVVDEGLSAALLARRLDADLLLMATDVEAVLRDRGRPEERPIATAGPTELRSLHLEESSIGPQIEAGCRFAASTGRRAAIGSLAEAARIVRGEAGTQILADDDEPAIAAARRLPGS